MQDRVQPLFHARLLPALYPVRHKDSKGPSGLTSVKTIRLTQGQVALVDDADFSRVAPFQWYAARYRKMWYAQREIRPFGGRKGRTTIKLHREILGLAPQARVDHEDRDGLNNQRRNLRPCSNPQNGANRIKFAGYGGTPCTSRYKGVHKRRESGKWRAYIRVDRKLHHLGTFQRERSEERRVGKE